MGDNADYTLDQMSDLDELFTAGEVPYNESPFNYEVKAHGPGPCPDCGGATQSIYGKYGWFYGCKQFPVCKGRRGV